MLTSMKSSGFPICLSRVSVQADVKVARGNQTSPLDASASIGGWGKEGVEMEGGATTWSHSSGCAVAWLANAAWLNPTDYSICYGASWNRSSSGKGAESWNCRKLTIVLQRLKLLLELTHLQSNWLAKLYLWRSSWIFARQTCERLREVNPCHHHLNCANPPFVYVTHPLSLFLPYSENIAYIWDIRDYSHCFIVQTKIQKRMTCISIGLSSLEGGIAKLTVNESQEKWGRFLPSGKLMTATFITVTSICKSTQVGLENIALHAV